LNHIKKNYGDKLQKEKKVRIEQILNIMIKLEKKELKIESFKIKPHVKRRILLIVNPLIQISPIMIKQFKIQLVDC
jgi:hypothetical protein